MGKKEPVILLCALVVLQMVICGFTQKTLGLGECSMTNDLMMIINEIESTEVEFALGTKVDQIEYWYLLDEHSEGRFLLKCEISENEYEYIVMQLEKSNQYDPIENNDTGYKRLGFSKRELENSLDISMSDVIGIWRLWSRGKYVWTLTTLFIFTFDNGSIIITIYR